MHKTISQLWNGKLVPVEHFGKSNSGMRRLERLIHINLETFAEENSHIAQRELYEHYHRYMNEYISVSCKQAFDDGFCLGVKITAEALLSTKSC